MKKNYYLLFLNLLCLGIVHAQNEFITTWETTTANESITIPTTGSGYNYTVDWGDGTIETGFIGDASHPYVDTGIHTVTITGDFPRIYFANSGDKDKILTVEQWGTIAWTNFLDAFSGCTNLDVTASDAPDLSNVIYLVRVFNGCTSLGTSETLDFSNWDTSGIVAFGGAFQNAIAFNSETIKNWDVGKCNGFVQMFSGATSFNQDISNWNIGENSNGTRNMLLMFNNATNFNQSLGNWDISKVTNMSNMLNNSGLSQQNYDATLLGWATDASGDLSDGIDDIPTGIDLGASGLKYCLGESARTTLTDPTGFNWNITDDGAACDVTEAFITTWRINTNNEEISLPIPDTGLDFTVDWGDGIITNETEEAYHTYINAGTYTIRVLGSFNRMRFNGNADRRKIRTIEQWGSNKWTSMESAFKGCSWLDINATDAPDLSNATSMVSMFENGACIDNGGNLANWNTSTILLMDNMFRSADMNENINTWDVSNVKSINNMFQACENFNYPLDQWNTGNLESAAAVFVDAKAFNQSLGDWNLSSILDLTDIFGGVNSLSDENYDKTLIGWATLESGESLSSNVTLGAGDAQYCFAEDARSTLTLAPNNWIITDGGAKCTSTDFFITTWETTAADESITIATSGDEYNYTVDWGDGTIETGFIGDASHLYTTVGMHTVKITGDFPRFTSSNNLNNARKLRTIEQWGTITWNSFSNAFYGCTNLEIVATDVPDLSNVTSLNQMFRNCVNLQSPDFSNWDTSNITNMGLMFTNARNFNGNISTWDVGNVTDFNSMLIGVTRFNQNISGWNIGEHVVGTINMNSMLIGTENFDQNLGAWNLEKVTDISGMLVNSGLSITNYDATLIGWAENSNTPSGLHLGASNLTYCLGEAARNILADNSGLNWRITDGGFGCADTDFFITTWETTAANEYIRIPTVSSVAYNFSVDWGDGTISRNLTSTVNHEYAAAGTYTVKIYGDFPQPYFDNASQAKPRLQTIEQWGTQQWVSMVSGFEDCPNLKLNADDVPDLSQLTSLEDMFSKCTNFEDLKDMMQYWDVSTITTMRNMFSSTRTFNENIGSWNVGNVENFSGMFNGNTVFNQDISNWNIGEFVSGDVNMAFMFLFARSFNQPLNKWDVSKVDRFDFTFSGAVKFNQDLSGWDISSANTMSNMLDSSGMSVENYEAILKGWATDSSGDLNDGIDDVPDLIIFGAHGLRYCSEEGRNILIDDPYRWTIIDGGKACPEDMFVTTWLVEDNDKITIPTDRDYSYVFTIDWGDGTSDVNVNKEISHNYTSAGTYIVTISGSFPRIYFKNSVDKDKIVEVNQWGTQQWISMESAFQGCTNLKLNADDTPDLSQVTRLWNMFSGCTNFEDLKGQIGNWDMTDITSISNMFKDCIVFDEDISSWTFTKLESANSTFSGATAFNQDISNWDMSKVNSLASMFEDGTSFNQPIGNWTLGVVDYINNIFAGATSFNQDLSNWDFSNVYVASDMFNGATAFDQDLSAWDISNVEVLDNIFTGTAMSQENYDKTLIGWATLEDSETQIPTRLTLDADVAHCLSVDAVNTLTNTTYNWTINDLGNSCPEDFFITTWQTTASNESITIPTNGVGYNYIVDWGDGAIETGFTGDASHEYAVADIYTVKITGDFPRLYINGNSAARDKIIAVDQWGTQQWTSMESAFSGCYNLKLNADDTPDLSQVTSMSSMFRDCTNLEDLKDTINSWDMTTIESIASMFNSCTLFNENIGGWTFTSLTDAYNAFEAAATFNQDISNWDVSKVDEFDAMFKDATSFNQPIGKWTLGTVDYIDRMFKGATSFNQDLSNWDFSNVYEAGNMFEGATSFNQDLSSWDISNVEALDNFFTRTAMSTENYDKTLIGWATLEAGETAIPADMILNADATYCLGESARNTLTSPTYNWEINDGGRNCPGDAFITTWLVADGDEITIPIRNSYTYNYTIDWGDGTVEYGLTAEASHTYTTGDTYEVKITGEFPALVFNLSGSSSKLQTIEQWGTQQWRRLINSFSNCVNLKLNADDVPDLSLIDSTSSMFQGCTNFEDLKDQIGNWDMSNISIISSMFNECTIFNENISDWTFTKLTRAVYTFRNATSFNQDISNWDMSKVDDMEGMFLRAKAFNQPIGNWTLNEVGYMTSFLEEASSFNQDLSNWNMSDVYDIRYMFYGASSFNQDLSSWDISNVEGFDDFFTGSGMTQENYDKTLIGWATLEAGETAIPADMTLNADASYCLAEAARNTLTSSTYNWTINDGGHNCPTPVITLLGDNPQIIEQGDIYVELGATVTYGATLVIDASTVNTNQLGTYTVTYTATTPSGGVATPVIRTVNIEEPCPLLSLSANNFTITTASETCVDTNNGMITVNAATALDYTTTINGVDYDFTSTLTVDNLAPGTYSVCIGVNGITNCEQCFEAVIEGGENLEGKTELITQAGNSKVNIVIASGTAPYTVMINNEEKGIFDIATFDIDVQHGDHIEVISSIACEGKLTTTNVNLINEFVIAPNPAHDHVIISVPNTGLNNLQVSLYNAIGVHISSGIYTLDASKVTLPMSSLPQGIYFITINEKDTFKVVKE
ncbi:BspA family leucine-rich repeat surface protein [Aquimarina sp. 2201CG1-2-11]|uniref:BspA family leucine-rich repeat surface protein n=1 Tax=Aquimarina discodermiae TaxID=3231043 RepID=UPI00346291B8